MHDFSDIIHVRVDNWMKARTNDILNLYKRVVLSNKWRVVKEQADGAYRGVSYTIVFYLPIVHK